MRQIIIIITSNKKHEEATNIELVIKLAFFMVLERITNINDHLLWKPS